MYICISFEESCMCGSSPRGTRRRKVAVVDLGTLIWTELWRVLGLCRDAAPAATFPSRSSSIPQSSSKGTATGSAGARQLGEHNDSPAKGVRVGCGTRLRVLNISTAAATQLVDCGHHQQQQHDSSRQQRCGVGASRKHCCCGQAE